MIGQSNLVNKINSLAKLPHSIILYGEKGSEQDEVCDYIADKFGLIQFDMTEFINNDFINEVYSSVTQTLYTVDLSKMDTIKQNILLKLFEEPTEYAHIILLAYNDEQAIETLKTRSYILKCDLYTTEQLESLVTNSQKDLVLKICKTPGQIEIANRTEIKTLYELCNKIIDVMKNAAYMNALSISNKINFKDEYEKYDLYIFILMLKYVLLTRSVNENVGYIHKELINIEKYIWSMVNKQMYFESFITSVWRKAKLV